MIKTLSKITILSILAFSLISCRQNEVSTSEKEYTKRELFNTENFKFFGKAHNEALNYAFAHIDTKNISKLSYYDIESRTNFYFDEIYEPTSRFKEQVKDIHYEKLVKSTLKTNSLVEIAKQKKSLEGKSLGSLEANYIGDLEDILDDSNGNFTPIPQQIDNLNQQIVDDPTLTEDEMCFLLLTNSIALYSSEYWYTDESSSLKQKLKMAKGSEYAKINWDDVARADIGGFILGFPAGAKAGLIRGAIIGALSGEGVGAVPGAIIGALGWGAASGARAAAAASGVAAVSWAIWGD